MGEEDLDIVKIMIENMLEETELQMKIKFYMETHKTECNYFIYKKYMKEVTFFNAIFKSLKADLGAEIARIFVERKMV